MLHNLQPHHELEVSEAVKDYLKSEFGFGFGNKRKHSKAVEMMSENLVHERISKLQEKHRKS